MAIKGRDREFRLPKITYVDFKHIEMDRVLVQLFPRLKFEGYASRRPPRRGDLSIDEFAKEFLDHPEWFAGFSKHPGIVYKWIETDLLDVVNRGKANQAVASPRPLHGEVYRFRNARYSRDYGAAEQIYWMIYYARQESGQRARDSLKHFFFPAIDLITDEYDPRVSIDVETQALLRFSKRQVKDDLRDSKEPTRYLPLCIGQADLLVNDILRLLAYENHMPRSVLVEYLKTLLAFHLTIYHLRLLKMVPKMVQQGKGEPICELKACTMAPGEFCPQKECPHRVAILVDMGHPDNPRMRELAQRSADIHYRRIPRFVQAHFTIKKLDEMAEYLSKKVGKLSMPASGYFSVPELLQLLQPAYKSEREAYFKARLAGLIEGSSTDGELDPEIRQVMEMGLNDFDTYIEILMAYRGRYHRQYITECLDSFLRKNKDSGLLVQSRAKGSPRCFAIGSRLLEVLLQLAVLARKGASFETREIRVEDLLLFLRERYGLYVDRLPADDSLGLPSILDRQGLRLNVEAFRKRLREIGFFQDLSDAYITQMVTPRYTISTNKKSAKGSPEGNS